ncbi:MAG: DUF4388 domain-containing protein [Nocardioidaceae bacterium]
MKLEGSLDAFGLPDIFQLLSYTKKTGGLHLRNGAVEGVVFFASGAVTGASADCGRQTLARRVVGRGGVDDVALEAAVARAADGVGVARGLLDAGAVDGELVRQAASEQAVDAVHDLLGWPEGDFAFSVDEVNPDDVGVELATEQVVAEAAGLTETADAAAGEIPSYDLVLGMPVVAPADLAMDADEWALVALADGRRDVAEIIELTGCGPVTVVSALAGLVRRGLLQPVGGASDHAAAVRRLLALLEPLERPAGAVPAAPPTPSPPVPSSAAGSAGSADRSEPAEAAEAAEAPERAAPAAPPGQDEPAPADAAAEVAEPVAAEPVADHDPEAVTAGARASIAPRPSAFAPAQPSQTATVGGPHVPDDVVPPRPEPFQAPRQPEHPEELPAPARPAFESARAVDGGRPAPTAGGVTTVAGVGGVNGSAAMAPDPEAAAVIERDPSVNRSLLLRLIAGVRGL